MTAELLPIGAFARLCRLSVKQLRHYDEVGLLTPARVDPATGYRYYRRDQVRDAMAIALLRTLDVPLGAIAEVLGGDEEARAAALRAEQARLESRIAAQRRSWQALDRLLADGLLRQEVVLAREPARRLLVVRAVCAAEEIGAATAGCVARLMAAFPAGSSAGWSPPVWGIFPADLEPPMRILVGVQSAAAAPPGTEVEHLPAGPAAVTTHLGPYEQLPVTYHAVFAWIHEHGLRPRGTAREAYLADPTSTEPALLTTRIVVPLIDEELS